MSQVNGRKEIDASKYRAMSDDELEEILRLDFYKEESDEDLQETLLAMKILAERKRERGEVHKTPEEAFESFKKYYVPELDDTVLPNLNTDNKEAAPKKRKANPMLRLRRAFAGIAAAVVIVFLTSFSVKAMGFDIWGFVIKWTKETFSYHTGAAIEVPPPDTVGRYPAASEEEFLRLHDMTTAFIPRWLPEGFSLDDMTIEETYHQKAVLFKYKNEDKEIQLAINTHISDDMYSIEKSSVEYDIHHSGGIVMYIYDNHDITQGFWATEAYECCLSGQISKDEIIMIFDSMEKGDPNENEKT